MKTVLSLLLFVSSFNCFCQSPYQHWQWARSFYGNSVDMKIKNGFLYVTGTFVNTSNWDATTLTSNGQGDIFVAKLDTNNNVIWAKNFGGLDNDSPSQLEINDNGQMVIKCASGSSSLTIGTITLNNPSSFFIELNSDGNVLNAVPVPQVVNYADIDIGNDGSVYIGALYYAPFSFAGAMIDTSAGNLTYPAFGYGGGVILKYDINGNESWARNIQYRTNSPSANPFALSSLAGSNMKIRIECSWPDASVSFLFMYAGYTRFNGTIGTSSGAPTGNLNVQASRYAKIASDGTVISESLYVPIGTLSTQLYDFQIGHSGLSYTSYTHFYISSGAGAGINSQFDGTAIHGIGWSLSAGPLPLSLSDIQPNETGNFLLVDSVSTKNVIVFNSNLQRIKKTEIPEVNSLNLGINSKNMNDTNAIYFAGSFTPSPLILNAGVPLTTPVILQNGYNFIGKYLLGGVPMLSFPSTAQTNFKICQDSILLNLQPPVTGVPPYSYHWQNATALSNPDVLNPKVFLTSGTVNNTLTITDANGAAVSKNFSFYKGPLIDLHIVLSDSSVCVGDTVKVSLRGTDFERCYFDTNPYQSQLTPNPFFRAFTDTLKYAVSSNHFIRLLSDNYLGGNYCYDTSSIAVIVNPRYNQTKDTSICSGSSFTFPDNTVQNNITTNTSHTSYLQAYRGCDSIIVTNISVGFPYSLTENIFLCSGSNHTFPDGTAQNNITANTSHTSHLVSISGCDSIINTNISINPTYNQTQNITLCSGSNYTFPDGTALTNITANTSHTSHLNTINGCDSSINTNININPTYNQTQNITLCAGSNYTFPDGTTQTNILANTIHISHFNTINGCDSVYNTAITVTHIDTSITKDGLVLTANSTPANYQWLDCSSNSSIPSQTGQSYTASSVGSYAVQITKSGCTDTSSCYPITTTDLTGGRIPLISVYPVPTRSSITIIVQSDISTDMQIAILDNAGAKVQAGKINLLPGRNSILYNISSLAPGLYSLKLMKTDTHETVIKKIIKL